MEELHEDSKDWASTATGTDLCQSHVTCAGPLNSDFTAYRPVKTEKEDPVEELPPLIKMERGAIQVLSFLNDPYSLEEVRPESNQCDSDLAEYNSSVTHVKSEFCGIMPGSRESSSNTTDIKADASPVSFKISEIFSCTPNVTCKSLVKLELNSPESDAVNQIDSEIICINSGVDNVNFCHEPALSSGINSDVTSVSLDIVKEENTAEVDMVEVFYTADMREEFQHVQDVCSMKNEPSDGYDLVESNFAELMMAVSKEESLTSSCEGICIKAEDKKKGMNCKLDDKRDITVYQSAKYQPVVCLERLENLEVADVDTFRKYHVQHQTDDKVMKSHSRAWRPKVPQRRVSRERNAKKKCITVMKLMSDSSEAVRTLLSCPPQSKSTVANCEDLVEEESSIEDPWKTEDDASGTKRGQGRRRKHRKAPKECAICFKLIRTDMMRHIRTCHIEDKRYSCEVCKKGFYEHCALRMHMRVHTGERPCVCEVCGKSYKQPGSLTEHMHVHTGLRPYKCKECGLAFAYPAGLRKHETVHTGEKPYRCKICGKGFRQLGGVKSHMTSHSSDRPVVCRLCDKRFKNTSALNTHMVVHNGVKSHECPVCHVKFLRRGGLRAHIQTHTNEKPFTCEICGVSFTRNTGLRVHRATMHTSERPFSCHLCDKSFRRLDCLQGHLERHKGLKENCKICNKLVRLSSMRSHLLTHTGKKKHECKICGMKFLIRGAVMQHLRQFHYKTGSKWKRKVQMEEGIEDKS